MLSYKLKYREKIPKTCIYLDKDVSFSPDDVVRGK